MFLVSLYTCVILQNFKAVKYVFRDIALTTPSLNKYIGSIIHYSIAEVCETET